MMAHLAPSFTRSFSLSDLPESWLQKLVAQYLSNQQRYTTMMLSRSTMKLIQHHAARFEVKLTIDTQSLEGVCITSWRKLQAIWQLIQSDSQSFLGFGTQARFPPVVLRVKGSMPPPTKLPNAPYLARVTIFIVDIIGPIFPRLLVALGFNHMSSLQHLVLKSGMGDASHDVVIETQADINLPVSSQEPVAPPSEDNSHDADMQVEQHALVRPSIFTASQFGIHISTPVSPTGVSNRSFARLRTSIGHASSQTRPRHADSSDKARKGSAALDSKNSEAAPSQRISSPRPALSSNSQEQPDLALPISQIVLGNGYTLKAELEQPKISGASDAESTQDDDDDEEEEEEEAGMDVDLQDIPSHATVRHDAGVATQSGGQTALRGKSILRLPASLKALSFLSCDGFDVVASEFGHVIRTLHSHVAFSLNMSLYIKSFTVLKSFHHCSAMTDSLCQSLLQVATLRHVRVQGIEMSDECDLYDEPCDWESVHIKYALSCPCTSTACRLPRGIRHVYIERSLMCRFEENDASAENSMPDPATDGKGFAGDDLAACGNIRWIPKHGLITMSTGFSANAVSQLVTKVQDTGRDVTLQCTMEASSCWGLMSIPTSITHLSLSCVITDVCNPHSKQSVDQQRLVFSLACIPHLVRLSLHMPRCSMHAFAEWLHALRSHVLTSSTHHGSKHSPHVAGSLCTEIASQVVLHGVWDSFVGSQVVLHGVCDSFVDWLQQHHPQLLAARHDVHISAGIPESLIAEGILNTRVFVKRKHWNMCGLSGLL